MLRVLLCQRLDGFTRTIQRIPRGAEFAQTQSFRQVRIKSVDRLTGPKPIIHRRALLRDGLHQGAPFLLKVIDPLARPTRACSKRPSNAQFEEISALAHQ